jgi:ornithine cyclodeaminase/alanine dehydrogenase-like protein (mu-crystallin family)
MDEPGTALRGAAGAVGRDPVVLLGRRAVAELLPLAACIDAVEAAFRLLGEGRAPVPGTLGHPVPGGGFHVKVASIQSGRHYFAAKVNGNFSDNPGRRGLPTIQGVVVLADADTGAPLAVLDSGEVTALRTGAATAVAARRLARPDSTVATIVGCGVQGRVQLQALRAVLPLERVFTVDIDRGRAEALADEARAAGSLRADATAHVGAAVAASHVCVTCTSARRPVLRRAWVRPGTFVAAVGADARDKQELEPALLAAGRLVVDVLEQCAMIGELAHALREGVLTRDGVAAELGQVVAGLRPGRRDREEIIVFDSTGTAIQDVAAAALAYERAVASGRGVPVDLGA